MGTLLFVPLLLKIILHVSHGLVFGLLGEDFYLLESTWDCRTLFEGVLVAVEPCLRASLLFVRKTPPSWKLVKAAFHS